MPAGPAIVSLPWQFNAIRVFAYVGFPSPHFIRLVSYYHSPLSPSPVTTFRVPASVLSTFIALLCFALLCFALLSSHFQVKPTHSLCVVLDLLPKGPRMDRGRQVRPTGVPRTHQGRDLREPKSGQGTRHAPSSARLVQVMPMSPGPMTPTSPGSPYI